MDGTPSVIRVTAWRRRRARRTGARPERGSRRVREDQEKWVLPGLGPPPGATRRVGGYSVGGV